MMLWKEYLTCHWLRFNIRHTHTHPPRTSKAMSRMCMAITEPLDVNFFTGWAGGWHPHQLPEEQPLQVAHFIHPDFRINSSEPPSTVFPFS